MSETREKEEEVTSVMAVIELLWVLAVVEVM